MAIVLRPQICYVTSSYVLFCISLKEGIAVGDECSEKTVNYVYLCILIQIRVDFLADVLLILNIPAR